MKEELTVETATTIVGRDVKRISSLGNMKVVFFMQDSDIFSMSRESILKSAKEYLILELGFTLSITMSRNHIEIDVIDTEKNECMFGTQASGSSEYEVVIMAINWILNQKKEGEE